MYTNESNRILRARKETVETQCGSYVSARAYAKERMHFSGAMLHSSLSGPEDGGGDVGKKEGKGEHDGAAGAVAPGNLLAGTSILMGMGFSTFSRHMLPR